MKRLIQIPIVSLLLLIVSNELFAQFTLTGELRPRTEFRNGFKRLKDKGTDPAFFIEQRSRLYFDYKREKIQVHLSLQDIRIWGATDQIYKQDPALFNVYEAYAAYAFNERYGFKVGRQAMNYNNARFLGNLDWAQQGRSHDALLFTKKDAARNCQLHLAVAYNQPSGFEPGNLSGTEYFDIKNYKTMIFGWWDKKFDNGGMSVLFHNDGRQIKSDTSMAHRQTYAVLGNYNLEEFKLDGEFYYQGGKNGGDVSVSGLMIALHGTYETDITPLTFGFEYLSGTARGDDKDKSFNPLYGTNHKFYGFMDYFYVGNGHGQEKASGRASGLIDFHLKTRFKLGEKSNLAANVHYFASPVKIYRGFGTNNGTYGSSLGTEFDLVYTVVLVKDVKFNMGYSHMFATETMEAIKGGDRSTLNNWAWAMISFKPQLFTTAKEK